MSEELFENLDPGRVPPEKKYKFYFFGFSVTEQSKGYAPLVCDMLANLDRPVSCQYQAIGGATFNVIPFLADHLAIAQAEIAVFEISTCVRFSKDPGSYYDCLAEIARYCLSKNTFPCFIQLYRRGVDYEDDPLTQTVERFARDHGFPCRSFVPEVLEKREAGVLLDYLRDGTHTSDLGARFYAERIVAFLDELTDWPRPVEIRLPRRRAMSTCFLPIAELLPRGAQGLDTFERAHIRSQYLTLPQGDSVELRLPEDHVFNGLFVMMGPRTGKLRVSFPEFRVKKWRILFDRKSYYRRYSFWFLRGMEATRLILTQLDTDPGIALDKGTPWDGAREANIVGVMAARREGALGIAA